MSSCFRAIVMATALAAYGCTAPPAEPDGQLQPPPFADIHLHYNYDHEEYISPQAVVDILKERNVVLGVVSSVPSAHALKLAEAGEGWILPLFTPYYQAGNRHNWFFDEQVVTQARAALASGKYAGIGEMHLAPGLGPRRDNPVVQGLIELADRYDVPVLIHTDASDHRYLLPICRSHSQVRFLWAHAGGILGPDELRPLLEACPNVWLEFSARDPWHYAGFAGKDGSLGPDWRRLIIDYQDRIMTGTDPVWNAHQMYRWYEADQGWKHYDKFFQFQHNWMATLPEDVARRIRLTNAQHFFGIRGRELQTDEH